MATQLTPRAGKKKRWPLCKTCEGTGYTRRMWSTWFFPHTCRHCGGTGLTGYKPSPKSVRQYAS
jgi:DnaJ-class molecular chaperone